LRTRVELVRHGVAVKVSEAGVAEAVLVGILLAGVGQEWTVVSAIGNAVAIRVIVTIVTLAVAVDVQLIGVVVVRTVVRQIGDTVQVTVITVITGVAYNMIEILKETFSREEI
jgi:hypothetical protein